VTVVKESVKRSSSGTVHPLPTTAEIMNEQSYTSTVHMPS